MKHKFPFLVLLVMFGLSALNLQGQEKVRWYSIEEAFLLSAKEPRVLVIDVYTDWCGWCKRMDATTFSDPKVAASLNNDFYPVKLNAEGKEDIVIGDRTYKFVDNGKRGYHELAAIVTKGRLSYPTIACVDEKGRVFDPAPGYQGPDQFMVLLDYYRGGAFETQSLQEYRQAKTPIMIPDI